VWSRNLMNEEAVARVGPQRCKKQKNIFKFYHASRWYIDEITQ
jgi:hypothetical protein